MAVANEAPVTEQQTEANKAAPDEFEAAFAEASSKRQEPSQPAAQPEPKTTEAAAPAAAEQPKTGTQSEPTPAAVTPPPADIWANATPEQRAAFEATAAEVDKFKHAASSAQGREQAMRRQVATLIQQAHTTPDHGNTPKAGEVTTGAEKAAQAAVTSEGRLDFDGPEWAAVRNDYPDIAKFMERAVRPVMEENAALRRDFDEMSDRDQADHIDEQERIVAKKHPDWLDVTATREWKEWLAGQQRYVQEGVVRNATFVIDADEVVDILTRFKRDITPAETKPQTTSQTPAASAAAATQPASTNLTAKRKEQLDANLSTSSKGTSPASGPHEDDFEANFAEAVRKKRQGLLR